MLLDRHRVTKLVELSAWERSLRGPERTLREEDVALLIKAAYDDATEQARAEFMARVGQYPTSAWPWSAVQAVVGMQPRGGGGGNVGGIAIPMPGVPTTPAVLSLIRGQAESADVDPGNRLPTRGTAESIEWEPLHKALDAWDTMLPAAQRFSDLLGAQLLDDQRTPLGRQRIAALRDELRAIDRKREQLQIRPGW